MLLIFLDPVLIVQENTFGTPLLGSWFIKHRIARNDNNVSLGSLPCCSAVETYDAGILLSLYHVSGKSLPIGNIIYVNSLIGYYICSIHQPLIDCDAAFIVEVGISHCCPV